MRERSADGRPRKNPTPKAIPIIANAIVRCCLVVLSEMYACAIVRFPAVTPSMARPRKTIHSASARASTRNPMKVPSWLTRSRRLRPKRSDRFPRNGAAKNWHAAYVETRAVAIMGVAPKCSA
jgi:hypothetical protein